MRLLLNPSALRFIPQASIVRVWEADMMLDTLPKRNKKPRALDTNILHDLSILDYLILRAGSCSIGNINPKRTF